MSKPIDPDLFDEALRDANEANEADEADEADFPADDWSLDEFDDDADLSSLSSAWMGSHDRFE